MFEHSSELRDRKSLETLLSTQQTILDAVRAIQQEITKPDKKYVYGIMGLANMLHCSRPTAQRIKDSGMIDDAVIQIGHTIIIDAEMAMELLKGRRTCERRK